MGSPSKAMMWVQMPPLIIFKKHKLSAQGQSMCLFLYQDKESNIIEWGHILGKGG